jgi:hypothetical protein
LNALVFIRAADYWVSLPLHTSSNCPFYQMKDASLSEYTSKRMIAAACASIPLKKQVSAVLGRGLPRQKGTGIGLPIVKKTAEAHDRSLEILGHPVRGVTFRLILPCPHK